MKLSSFFLRNIQAKGGSDLQETREKILRALLYFASSIGGLIYIFAMIPAINQKLYVPALLYSVYYFVLVWITFFPNFPYRFRTYAWLLILYFLAIINLIYSGFNVDAGLFFLAFVIMSNVFLGFNQGVISLVLSLLSIIIAGFEIVRGNGVFTLGLSQTNPMLWFVGGAIFLLMGLVSSISVGVLIDEVKKNLKALQELAANLAMKNAEIAERELNYRILIETAPDVIIRIDLDGNIVAINPAGERLLGLSENKNSGLKISDFVQPADQPLLKQIFEKAQREGVLRDVELRIFSLSGKSIIVEFSVAVTLDANAMPASFIAIGNDITEKKAISELVQKKNEDLIKTQDQLKKLARRLILVEENERHIISRELHDDAGQILIVLQHSLGRIFEDCEEERSGDALKEQLLNAIDLVKQAASSVRLSSHRLRPAVLEIGGLWVGLEELCKNITSQSRLDIELMGEPVDNIPDDLAISLYRFVQEGITNSLKHSDATKAIVNLSYEDGKVIVSVVDNGLTPIATEKLQDRHSGIGLLGLRERLSPFHGEVETFWEKGRGFVIRAIVPWQYN